MSAISIAPIEWSALRDIDEVEPINDGDSKCLGEVRDVLIKHGMINRFGLALLHSHFEVAEDEILLETSDHESRTLTTRAIKESEAPSERAGTVWMLGGEDVTTMGKWCSKYCYTTTFGRHTWHHRRVRD